MYMNDVQMLGFSPEISSIFIEILLSSNAWCTLEDFQFLEDLKNVRDHRRNDRFNRF